MNAVAAYLARATEALTRAGLKGYLLRIESRRTWSIDGTVTGGTVLVSRAHGEIADVVIEDDSVISITPRDNQIYAFTKAITDAIKDDAE